MLANWEGQTLDIVASCKSLHWHPEITSKCVGVAVMLCVALLQGGQRKFETEIGFSSRAIT